MFRNESVEAHIEVFSYFHLLLWQCKVSQLTMHCKDISMIDVTESFILACIIFTAEVVQFKVCMFTCYREVYLSYDKIHAGSAVRWQNSVHS